ELHQSGPLRAESWSDGRRAARASTSIGADAGSVSPGARTRRRRTPEAAVVRDERAQLGSAVEGCRSGAPGPRLGRRVSSLDCRERGIGRALVHGVRGLADVEPLSVLAGSLLRLRFRRVGGSVRGSYLPGRAHRRPCAIRGDDHLIKSYAPAELRRTEGGAPKLLGAASDPETAGESIRFCLARTDLGRWQHDAEPIVPRLMGLRRLPGAPSGHHRRWP